MFSTTSFSRLVRERVIVYAGGVTYRGLLMEVTTTDIKLKGETGWIIVPMGKVRRVVKEGEEGPPPLDPTRESSAELFMDDETLAAMQREQEAADQQQHQPSATTDLPDPFDISAITDDFDFNPVPMAPFDERTPTEFKDLPGIPQENVSPVVPPGPGAQAPPVAPAPPVAGARPPSKPPPTTVGTDSDTGGFRAPQKPPVQDESNDKK